MTKFIVLIASITYQTQSAQTALSGNDKSNLDMMTQLATHMSTDGTCNAKQVGTERITEAIEHHPIFKCQQTKKLALTWQLQANASDLFVDKAISTLGTKADDFLFKKTKEANLFKGGSATTDVNMQDLLVDYRDKAFKYMAHGMMDFCYNDNQYRKHLSGLGTPEAEGLVKETKKLATYQLQTVFRQVQQMANAVWKEVEGENIDFSSNIPNWEDLNSSKKKEFKDLQDNLLKAVGPSFKVIEANLKSSSDKEKFVGQQRRLLDTYIYISQVVNNSSNNHTFTKLSMNIQELKADGHLIMKLLEDQKWLSGDDEKDLALVRTVVDQLGNALESAFMWKKLFSRAHDDSEFYKKIVDDFSACALINYRYKYTKYIVRLQDDYKTYLWDDQKYDKGITYDFDTSFFGNVLNAYPAFVFDALNKRAGDEDNEWLHRQKLALKLNVFKAQGRMLYGPQTNIVITHAQNKSDVAKEMEGVQDRQRNLMSWLMKHGDKTIKNKMFGCKGCGGPWALMQLWRKPNFYRKVDLEKTNGGALDNKLYMVGHRVLGSSTLVAKQGLVLDQKFNKTNTSIEVISDIKVPSKQNKKLNKLITTKLLTLDYKNTDLKFSNIDKEFQVRKKSQADLVTHGEEKGSKIGAAGVKIFMYQEVGKKKICVESLIKKQDAHELIVVDKHKQMYLVVGMKTLSIPSEECELVGIGTNVKISETGLWQPILVNRQQEFQKFSIIWSFLSPDVSEGIEDAANIEGVSYINFFETKDADPAVTLNTLETNKNLTLSISKRDISAQRLARENPKCVYKNHKEQTIQNYIQTLTKITLDMEQPHFNAEEKAQGVECSDITKLLVFDSFKEFGESVIKLAKDASVLGSFAVCGLYRKTVKISSKMSVLHLSNWKGKFEEKKKHSSPQIQRDYYLHVRVGQNFSFKDQLKTKLVPAHWLKLEPIKMGDKKDFLYATVLTRITPASKFLGLATFEPRFYGLEPKFEYPGFNKSTDTINTYLMQQLFGTGQPLAVFKKKIMKFVTEKAKDLSRHREFVKVKQDHNSAEGCDKGVRGISVTLNEKYEIEENCGNQLIGMEDVQQVEILFISAKEAAKVTGPKFNPPTEDEQALAAMNGQILVDAGMKNDELDAKIGFIKKRIWIRPNVAMPYELHSEDKK